MSSSALTLFQKNFPRNEPVLLPYGGEDGFSEKSLRVVCWNIQQGRNLHEQIEYLQEMKPDIALLQEVDWDNKRSSNLAGPEILARELQMHGAFGLEFVEIPSRLRPCLPWIRQGGGVTGNLILSRAPLRDARHLRLEQSAFSWESPSCWRSHLFSRMEPRIGQRSAVTATVQWLGRSLSLATTHLEDKALRGRNRLRQIKDVLADHQQRESEANLIAGDMNTYLPWVSGGGPECRRWKERMLEEGYSDPFDRRGDWTFQVSRFFRRKLDWVLGQGLHFTDSWVDDISLSDHRPLWSEIAMRNDPERLIKLDIEMVGEEVEAEEKSALLPLSLAS